MREPRGAGQSPCSLIWNGNRQRLLTPTQGTEVRYRPIQPDQFQQAFHKTCGLPQQHTEQHFDCEACLYGHISINFSKALFI